MKNTHNYPKNWRQLARACKVQAGWMCEKCGVKQKTVCISRWTGNVYTIYLQAAHVNHDPENPSPELVCVCATCHWQYYRKPGQRAAWMVAIEILKHQKLIAIAYCQ